MSDEEKLYRAYEIRKQELLGEVDKHKDEMSSLPQILQVRMEALKKLNPEKYAESPELILSTLAANSLIKKNRYSCNGIQNYLDKAHKDYNLERDSDISPWLLGNLVRAYGEDVENGAITRTGEIIDITISEVMKTPHGLTDNGRPIDAKEIVAEFVNQSKENLNTPEEDKISNKIEGVINKIKDKENLNTPKQEKGVLRGFDSLKTLTADYLPINHHTKKQVTPEQVEAAKYFVSEKEEASRKVWGFKKPKKAELEHRIYAKLVYTTDLEKMVEEYKKENSDSEYKTMQRENRYAQELLSRKLVKGPRGK